MNKTSGTNTSLPDDDLLVSSDVVEAWAREFADAFQQNPATVIRAAKAYSKMWRDAGLTNGALRQILRTWMRGFEADFTPRIRDVLGTCQKMGYLRARVRDGDADDPPTDEDRAYGLLYREYMERWGQGRITTPNMAGITVSLMHLYSILWEGAMLHDFEACCKSGEPNWDTVREVLCDVIGKVRLANPEYAEWLPVVSENAISYRGKVDNIPETESVAAVADLGIPF